MTENTNQLENIQIIKKQKHKKIHEQQPGYSCGLKSPIPECCGVNCPHEYNGCTYSGYCEHRRTPDKDLNGTWLPTCGLKFPEGKK